MNPVFYKTGDFPKQGYKLSVIGKFVFDNGKEQWNENHPASNIKIDIIRTFLSRALDWLGCNSVLLKKYVSQSVVILRQCSSM